FQHLVVQDRRALVEHDDRVVGELLLAQPAAAQEREMNVELRRPVAERARRREMTLNADAIRLAQALELIRRLDRTLVVEAREQGLWIHRSHSPLLELREALADVRDLPEIRRQCLPRLGARADRPDVEVPRP